MHELGTLITLALLAGFIVLVALPFRRRVPYEAVATGPKETRHVLEARKQELVATLRDLNLDFRMGKLDEKDFHELDARYRSQAINVLRKLDRASAKKKELQAEHLIAVYRETQGGASPPTNCPGCQQPLESQYRFCPRCGERVATDSNHSGANS
jgi:hypothetical protein